MKFQEWKRFDEEDIQNVHGHVELYRKLYEGNHEEIFPRAIDLIQKGEITDNIFYGQHQARNVQTPYIVANISKIIAEIPAIFVSRSIGKIESSLKRNEGEAPESISGDIDDYIDQSESGNDEVADQQQELIEQIQKDSNLQFQHWGNVLQQQVDGGLVGVPYKDNDTIKLEFKARDVYFPHSDGNGADLVFKIEVDEEKFIHVYREHVEDGDLFTTNKLFRLNEGSKTQAVGEAKTKEILDMEQLDEVYEGRTRPFIIYWPNEKTFMNPLGVSALKNQHGKQEEINWTLTRNAITFERNGKPRIAVSKEVMQALQDKAMERYGDESKIDHRDLEVTTFDDQGKALEVVQIDTTKIGDVSWVKDLMKMMMMETKTSEKAVDFYYDEGSGTQSGVAKFYDLFTSLIKSEQIQKEYIYFLKQLMESALWLANAEDESIAIEEPDIKLNSMMPVNRTELIDENKEAYKEGIESLETAIRKINPSASEEWIQEELERIETEGQDDDSFSDVQGGRQTLEQLMGNRDEDGNKITQDPDDQQGENGDDE